VGRLEENRRGEQRECGFRVHSRVGVVVNRLERNETRANDGSCVFADRGERLTTG